MRSRYLRSFFLVMMTVLLDQFSKRWGLYLNNYHLNRGIIFGQFEMGLHDIRIVLLCSFAGLIFFFYMVGLSVIPARGRPLKDGLSLVMGGILGNVTDKILYGFTIDFIPFQWGDYQMVFNLADGFLWGGSFLSLWVVFRLENVLWYSKNTRSSFLLWPKEQIKIALHFTMIVFCSSIVLGIFVYSFLKMALGSKNISYDDVMVHFFVFHLLMTLICCGLTFIASLFITHKSAEPLQAFEVYVNNLIDGSDQKFSLRDGDRHPPLETVAEKLRHHLKK